MPSPVTTTTNNNGGGGLLRLRSVLEQTTPGFATLQDFFLRWLNLDVTTLAVAITAFGAISTGTQQLKFVAGHIYRWVTRLFTASVSISGNDRLNREVLNWIGAQVLLHQETRILTARSEATQNDAWDFRRVTLKRNDFRHGKRLPIQYLPTFGITWFIHDRNIFLVRRIPEGRNLNPSQGGYPLSFDSPDQYVVAPAGHEPLVVMCLGRSVKPIKRFLETCREFADKQRESFITVRTVGLQYHRESWDNTILRPLRPLETVHMDKKVKDDLVNDIASYLKPATRRFYTTRGIPYRRGYLLYGPPGTGKTSLSLALAGQFGLELYIMHVPTLNSDSELERLFTALPPQCIVLLEDIDAVGVKRKTPEQAESGGGKQAPPGFIDDLDVFAKGRGRCSLSGLLNVLDGVTSQEGRIVLMTANVADNLDEALVRPGRIDKMIFMGKIGCAAAEDMFLRMYAPDKDEAPNAAETCAAVMGPEELGTLAAAFGRCVPPGVFTPAQLQGFLLNHRGQPDVAVAVFEAWAVEEQQRMQEAAEREEVAAKLKASRIEQMEDAKATRMAGRLAAALGVPAQGSPGTAAVSGSPPNGSSDSPDVAVANTNGVSDGGGGGDNTTTTTTVDAQGKAEDAN